MFGGPGRNVLHAARLPASQPLAADHPAPPPRMHLQYVCKRVSARVASGLPEEDTFCTEEERSDGLLQHCWVWR